MRRSLPLLASLAALFLSPTGLCDAPHCESGDCHNGIGRRVYPDSGGAVYEGAFVEGLWEGAGTLTVPGQYTYVGTFAGNAVTGVGKMTFPSGDVYEGAVARGVFEGSGIFRFANGEVLSGVFRNGQISSGEGYLPLPDGGNYRGHFENGAFNGQGAARLPNGSEYVGAFRNGKMHGAGKLTMANGDTFEGSFENGDLQGKGTCIAKSGLTYKGDFVGSQFHGYGEATYPEGRYTGEWQRGKRHGQGRFTDKFGIIQFVGQWADDVAKPETANHLPVIKQVLERTYQGYQYTTLNGVSGAMDVTIKLNLTDSYELWGTCRTTIVFDGVSYSALVSIAGRFDLAARTVRYHTASVLQEDKLPSGFAWINSKADTTLTVLNDLEHPGHFLLQGSAPEGDRMELRSFR